MNNRLDIHIAANSTVRLLIDEIARERSRKTGYPHPPRQPAQQQQNLLAYVFPLIYW
jgi:hypothetical protein